ncbi:MAG: 3-ketoacyl-ACP reductase [Planctomycetota bacterium]
MSARSSKPVALVTGASRGIGLAIAVELARNGYDIAGNATELSHLSRVRAQVEAAGGAFAAAAGDLADLSTHPRLLAAAAARFGGIDLLVSNAGIAPSPRRDLLETTPESFDRVLAVNARGAFFLAQAVARHMIERLEKEPLTRPAIVFITSISADTSSPTRAEYCISKAALSQVARLFAHRLTTFGINVYEVRPGLIATDMTAPVREKYDALLAGGLVPQKRWGEAEDVARAVAALARGDFAYSTGSVIEVSGGLNIRRL